METELFVHLLDEIEIQRNNNLLYDRVFALPTEELIDLKSEPDIKVKSNIRPYN